MPQADYRKISDLPDTIPLFPLGGALLFPRWNLPLNIFEPRYLNMIDDAMSGDRMIGMVQPVGGDKARPDLAGVGCAGRITSYSETEDRRYQIVLSGVSRFRLSELDVQTPYRQARADWAPFVSDLAPPRPASLPDRETLVNALEAYTERNGLDADWSAVREADVETLVSALSTGCPFATMEKQALLEAPDIAGRAEVLTALLEMDRPLPGGTSKLQ